MPERQIETVMLAGDEGEGLVEIFPNRGVRVRALDRERLIHSHEIGEALEAFLAYQFAEEASLSSLRKLEALQDAHDAALDWPRIDAANYAFHRFINMHGGNVEAAEIIIPRYYGLSESLLYKRGRTQAYADRVRAEHHALLDAFRDRDPSRAREISGMHVRATLQDVLDAFEATQAKPSPGPAGR